MLNKRAFTLSELLIALAVVGAIAALSIPAVVEDMNRRILASQLKNVSLSIQQLIGEELIKNKTQSLEHTDFANPAALLGSSNFAIADTCSSRENCVGDDYTRINGDPFTYPIGSYVTRKLKNGVTISYGISTGNAIAGTDDESLGIFYVDLNGRDYPNMLGRDTFAFRVSKKGRIFDGTKNNATNDSVLKNQCVTSTGGLATTCYTLVERNNWKITY